MKHPGEPENESDGENIILLSFTLLYEKKKSKLIFISPKLLSLSLSSVLSGVKSDVLSSFSVMFMSC